MPISSNPDENGIAMGISNPPQSRFMLGTIAILTGQSDEIVEGRLRCDGQNFRWSLGSKHLAVNKTQTGRQADLFIYDTDQRKLRGIVIGNGHHFDLGWSADSNDVAVFTIPCSESEVCTANLDIYDIQSSSQINSVDLRGLPFDGGSACNPVISQKLSSIAFTSNCGLAIPDSIYFPNEVYLWKLGTPSVEQITSNTLQKTFPFYARYDYAWLNDEEVLVGRALLPMPTGGENHSLSIYNSGTKRFSRLSNVLGAIFAPNSANQQMALIQRDVITLDSVNIGQEAQINVLPQSALQPNNFTPSISENLQGSISSQCSSAWSPDGIILATTYSAISCDYQVKGVAFSNANGLVSTKVQINKGTNTGDFYNPLGWLIRS